MRVLVACEESQRVTIELRKRGHEAYSCDLMEQSGGHPEWHIQGDVLPLLSQCWDMIIAFPPCTYLSNAGACRLYPRKGELDINRYHKGLEGKEFFLKFLNADCPKIAIENPVSSRIFEMPPYTQEIQPYMFGDPYTKKTRLWLKGLPPLQPTNIVEPLGAWVFPSRKKQIIKEAKRSSKNRSKTFIGIAKAMAEQWTPNERK